MYALTTCILTQFFVHTDTFCSPVNFRDLVRSTFSLLLSKTIGTVSVENNRTELGFALAVGSVVSTTRIEDVCFCEFDVHILEPF